jgi:hypothetical protein
MSCPGYEASWAPIIRVDAACVVLAQESIPRHSEPPAMICLTPATNGCRPAMTPATGVVRFGIRWARIATLALTRHRCGRLSLHDAGRKCSERVGRPNASGCRRPKTSSHCRPCATAGRTNRDPAPLRSRASRCSPRLGLLRTQMAGSRSAALYAGDEGVPSLPQSRFIVRGVQRVPNRVRVSHRHRDHALADDDDAGTCCAAHRCH